jgi:hypothetical protein
MTDLIYQLNPTVTNTDLDRLFAAAWPDHHDSDFAPILSRSLVYVCAYGKMELVGFVNVAWDGGIHVPFYWMRRCIRLINGVGLVSNWYGRRLRLLERKASIGCMWIMNRILRRFTAVVASNRH